MSLLFAMPAARMRIRPFITQSFHVICTLSRTSAVYNVARSFSANVNPIPEEEPQPLPLVSSSRLKRLYRRDPVACAWPGCTAVLSNRTSLNRHIAAVHRKEKPFPCSVPGCTSSFSRRSSLTVHIAAVHLKERPYICTETGCGMSFSARPNLRAHVARFHAPEGSFVCEQCSKEFKHKNNLKRHVTEVHKRKRWVCDADACGKSFSRRETMELHMAQKHAQAEGQKVQGEEVKNGGEGHR